MRYCLLAFQGWASCRAADQLYENISGTSATRYTPDFAELTTSRGTLAIGSTRTLAVFHAEDQLEPEANRSVILEFLVEDVDAEFSRLKEQLSGFVQEPTTMPWETAHFYFATQTAIL
ncbi:VOC family protein [Terriglobus sp.]|uniref:VOC family protein n=1 Tax=Terriglobus sp. TaxID=1889013 RepID=UPI003AFFE14C